MDKEKSFAGPRLVKKFRVWEKTNSRAVILYSASFYPSPGVKLKQL